jgi:hypothetical protein
VAAPAALAAPCATSRSISRLATPAMVENPASPSGTEPSTTSRYLPAASFIAAPMPCRRNSAAMPARPRMLSCCPQAIAISVVRNMRRLCAEAVAGVLRTVNRRRVAGVRQNRRSAGADFQAGSAGHGSGRHTRISAVR